MRRPLAGGFELDDDRGRIDRAEVHRFVSTESYWARGRARATMEDLIDGADRVVGLYAGDRQIGFCRAVSDGVAFAYLADVYVVPEFRGRGLGVELVREMVDNERYDRVPKWLLHTQDAHALYQRLGFGPPPPSAMERVRRPHG